MSSEIPGLRVYKFGGASVQDATGILNVCRIVRDTALGQPLLIVVSAVGKTTNALEEIFDLAFRGEDYGEKLKALRNYHTAIMAGLNDAQVGISDTWPYPYTAEDFFQRLTETLAAVKPDNYDEQYDQIVSFGEMLATYIVAKALGAQWIDAGLLIRTDNNWREGRVAWNRSEQAIREALPPKLAQGLVVTQGFIGRAPNHRTTTLGREGSDYSAAIFAYCLGAESVTIWKDVPGLLNADPRLFADTVLYPEISYQETIEMAYYGASVIHPKTLQPLAERGIPLYVKSFLDPAAPGTLIHDCQHPALAPAFIRKGGQCLLSFQSKDFAFISEENLAVIFGELARARLKINVMQNSAISFSAGTDYHPGRVQQLLAALAGQFSIHYNAGLTLFTIKHYDQASLERLTAGRALLLEQRTRSTFQFLVRE